MATAHDLPPSFVDGLKAAALRGVETRDLVAEVAASAASTYVADLRSEPRWPHPEPSVQSAYFTPVAFGATTLGVLALFAGEADAFSAEHRGLADLYAREVGHRWWLSEQTTQPAAASAVGLRQQAADAEASGVHDLMGELRLATEPAASADGSATTLDLTQLSERERDVVQSLCRGRRLAEIARELGISHHTARNHMKRVFKKLGVHSQVELLVILSNTRERTGLLLR